MMGVCTCARVCLVFPPLESLPRLMSPCARTEEHSNDLYVCMCLGFARIARLHAIRNHPVSSSFVIPWPVFQLHSKSLLHWDFCCLCQGSLRFTAHVPILHVPEDTQSSDLQSCYSRAMFAAIKNCLVGVFILRRLFTVSQGSISSTISTLNQGPGPADSLS